MDKQRVKNGLPWPSKDSTSLKGLAEKNIFMHRGTC